MLVQLRFFLPVVLVIVFKLSFCSASQPFCSATLYGSPSYRDCLSAWHSMPFALSPKTSQKARSHELYCEPQYLQPAFTRVDNPYQPLPINQVPKIWRYNTCRIALMSLGKPNRSVERAIWGANWRFILDQVQQLFACGSPRSGIAPSGGYLALNNERGSESQIAALYIYSSYSPFENMVNRHMSDGKPITPIASMEQVAGIDGSSSVSLINSTEHAPHMPMEMSLLRDITLLDQ